MYRIREGVATRTLAYFFLNYYHYEAPYFGGIIHKYKSYMTLASAFAMDDELDPDADDDMDMDEDEEDMDDDDEDDDDADGDA